MTSTEFKQHPTSLAPVGERAGVRGKIVTAFSFRVLLLAVFSLLSTSLHAAEDWVSALKQMPLNQKATEINNTNFPTLFLGSFQPNASIKALVLMPGATDEFYFFHRGNTKLSPTDDNLFAALAALTNQTQIRATFRAPFLLIHTRQDPLELQIKVKNDEMVERLKAKPFLPHVQYNDRDWNYLRPILIEQLDANFWPPQDSRESWHFFRHCFAGWNLNGWETLQAIAYAGKSTITVEKSFFSGRPKLSFYPDRRPPPN